MMENKYFFIKKEHQNTEQKERCFCNLYIIALYYCNRQKVPIYLMKTVPRKRQMPQFMNRI